jgi:predicted ATPase
MKTLRQVNIEGFKSIAKQTLELSDLNVVIGPNGSGKSNLIGVFRLLNRALSKNLQLYVAEQGGADRFLHHGRKHTPSMEVGFDFAQNAYGFRLKPALGDSLIFETESVAYHGHWNYAEIIARGHTESKLEEAAKEGRNQVPRYVLPQVANWVVYHFHDTSDSAPSKRNCDIDDNRFLRPDAANLAAYLYWLRERHATEYGHIVDHVRLMAPFFDDFALEPSRVNQGKIKLEWRQAGSDAYFDAYSLSDGTLRFICLATLLLQPSQSMPTLILLDEPELGLHPSAIRLLAEMLEAAAKRRQVLLATQSVTLLNQFTPEHVIVAENDDGATTFSRLDEKALADWLKNYSLGELWEKNVLGGRP